MKINRGLAVRLTLAGILALVALGIAAPFIKADGYREQIRGAIERALNRRVEIESVRFNLFTGPGFTAEKVVIYDDDSAGIEPFAHMPSLEARVHFGALLFGRLEFAMVRFVEPSLNLVKPDGGPWNLVPLLAKAGERQNALPEIQISKGRLNFKFGDTKSAFYVSNADMTISPESSGVFSVRFEGEPARTDRAAQGFGLFSGFGRLSDEVVDIDVELERSAIEELATLIRGRALGLHGLVAARARIQGPASAPAITGRLDIEDVHRWDLISSHTGGWGVNFKGKLDLPRQHMEIMTDRADNPQMPLSMRVSVAQLLTSPNWAADVGVENLPAPALIEFVRHMGAPLPAGLGIEGKVTGMVGYSSRVGLRGELTVDNATVELDGGPQFTVERASVAIVDDEIRLLPATLAGQENRMARLEATYAPLRQHVEARISGRGLRIAVPAIERFRGGVWSGELQYVSQDGAPGEWSAKVHVRDATTTVPGIQGPIRLLAADLDLDNSGLVVRRMRAIAGDTEFYGEYRYVRRSDRPHRFQLSMPTAELSDIENVLMPTLQREGNFLARTLRFRRSALPDWLRTRRAEGTVRIGTLMAGDIALRAVRTNVVWTGGAVQFSDFGARLDEGSMTGDMTADLTQSEPEYTYSGQIRNAAWRGSYFDVIGSGKGSGTGAALLLSLQSEGKFTARALSVGPEYPFRTVSGGYLFWASRAGPQVKLTAVEAAIGAERFEGEGSAQDGRLQVDLASSGRTVRLNGSVSPLKLEVTSDRAAVRP